jgi:hypothetical protein
VRDHSHDLNEWLAQQQQAAKAKLREMRTKGRKDPELRRKLWKLRADCGGYYTNRAPKNAVTEDKTIEILTPEELVTWTMSMRYLADSEKEDREFKSLTLLMRLGGLDQNYLGACEKQIETLAEKEYPEWYVKCVKHVRDCALEAVGQQLAS